jgi:hypothetical protein
MANPGTARIVRTLLRAAAVWILAQAALFVGARLAARRLDLGDESSTSVRRVLAMGAVELRPTNPALTRVRMDSVMGGGLLDLTAIPPVPGGIDVTVRSVMGGMRLLVPPGWTAWWSFHGAMGGVAADAGVERVTDPATADLRVHARAIMGGVGIETPKS